MTKKERAQLVADFAGRRKQCMRDILQYWEDLGKTCLAIRKSYPKDGPVRDLAEELNLPQAYLHKSMSFVRSTTARERAFFKRNGWPYRAVEFVSKIRNVKKREQLKRKYAKTADTKCFDLVLEARRQLRAEASR